MTRLRLPAAMALLSSLLLAKADHIELLQWNMHGECFTKCHPGARGHCDRHYPACKHNATEILWELMQGSHTPDRVKPDFASIQQLGDEEFISSGLKQWGKLYHTCGGAKGFGKYPFDIAVLYYDKSKWEPTLHQDGGCMERIWHASVNNYRAYVMQSFRRIDHASDTHIIVVAAHYTHAVWGLPRMQKQIASMQKQTGVKQLILLADTNRECSSSSESLMHSLYPSAETVASAHLHHTCCVPYFGHCYDRIIAAEFPGVHGLLPTTLPFLELKGRPQWAAPNMHLPIRARLSFEAAFASARYV